MKPNISRTRVDDPKGKKTKVLQIRNRELPPRNKKLPKAEPEVTQMRSDPQVGLSKVNSSSSSNSKIIS